MSAKKLQNKYFTLNEMSEEQISSDLLAIHILKYFFSTLNFLRKKQQIANRLNILKQENFLI